MVSVGCKQCASAVNRVYCGSQSWTDEATVTLLQSDTANV